MENSIPTTVSPPGNGRNALISMYNILFDDQPKEWIGFKPALGLEVYPCYSCKHMFSSKSSLVDHVNRRIVVFKYNCSDCTPNQVLTFYNRCSLLLHTRLHYRLDHGQVNLKEIDTFPLPISLAGFLPHPSIPLLYDKEDAEIDWENTYLNTRFYNPDPKDKGQQIIHLKPRDIIFKHRGQSLVLRQTCRYIPKCTFVTVEDQWALINRNILRENVGCMNESNFDNLQIKEEDEDQDEYHSHVALPVISKVESLQDNSYMLPKCLDCNTFQRCTMSEHYLGANKPIDNNLSCHLCKFVASTQCSLNAHIRIHGNVPPHVCPDCGKDFETWNALREHMDEVCFHLNKFVRFRCPGKKCGKLFASSTTFAVHFKVHLKCLFSCNVCNTMLFGPELAENHRKEHENCSFSNLYHCNLCPNLEALNESNYSQHIDLHTTDTERCIYVYMCKSCRSYFRSTATYATHLLRCSAKQNTVKKSMAPKYVTKECEGCDSKIIFNVEKPVKFCNKCKQTQESKTKVMKKYYCMLCNNQIMIEDKLKHMNMCKYAHPKIMVNRLPEEDIIEYKNYSSTSDDSLTPSKLNNKRSQTNSPKSDEQRKKRRFFHRVKKLEREIQKDLTAEEPREFDGTYLCKVCEYQDQDRIDFHSHIKCHRDISTAYQCMECGECFVVKPSLIKHLLYFHNIVDHENYLRDNDCYDIEALKELEETMKLAPGESKEPVKQNQCRVCRQEFQDSVALDKHFRIHGMAFLLRNSK